MKNCFLIGYGAGVGHGAASAFHSAGYNLALFSRNPQKVADLAGPLKAHSFAVDAGQPEALRAALEQAVSQLGPPEVVIYNAVAFRQALPSQLEPAELLADFSTNVVGALVATRTLLPLMKTGSLLFTGGGWALYPNASVSSTAIGKAGLRHFVLMLAQELQGSPVRAGTVTILGQVSAGGSFDPMKIGQTFWEMHSQPREQFQSEVQFTG